VYAFVVCVFVHMLRMFMFVCILASMHVCILKVCMNVTGLNILLMNVGHMPTHRILRESDTRIDAISYSEGPLGRFI